MADHSESQPPEDLHWGIAYLREDIQDVRQDIQGVRQEMRQEIQGVRQEIQVVRQEMRQEFQVVYGRIDSRFALLMTTMIATAGVLLAAIKL